MKKHLIFFSALSIMLSSCIKKELDMEVIEPKCKGFKIEDIYYQFIVDPTCDTSNTTGTLAIVGSIDGDVDCLYYMLIEATFYDINGNELTPTSNGSQKLGSEDIEIVNGSFIIMMDYTFAKADYPKINYIHLNYHTENELGNSSNELSLRANPSCKAIATPTTFDNTITISDSVQYITVNFSDHAAQDGDLISVNVNGAWVLENILLTNAGKDYSVPVTAGVNWFYLYALNQGSSGPNTVTITLHTNTQDLDFDFNLQTNESKTFKLIIQ